LAGIRIAQGRGVLEVARPETRVHARSHPQRFTWGIVDVILAVVMLPFGIWMFLIERLVGSVAAIFDR
jgi:hypothetical protein